MTTIKEFAYSLCKKVMATPQRETIRQVVRDITQVSAESKDRSSFGYFVDNYMHQQILGYLVADRDKSKFEKSFPPLSFSDTLTEDERLLFSGVHKEILKLNLACLTTVSKKLPPYYMGALEPYTRFGYSIPSNAVEIDLFSLDDVNQMAELFAEHPAFLAIERSQQIIDKISSNTLLELVLKFNQLFSSAGPFGVPKELERISFFSEDSEARLTYRHLSALISLRASLSVLDELIFQAILSNKLPVLDDTNIVYMQPVTSNIVGLGFSAAYQIDEQTFRFSPGLILVKSTQPEFSFDLCHIEYQEVAISEDYGDIGNIQLRVIDSDLNLYSNLLKTC